MTTAEAPGLEGIPMTASARATESDLSHIVHRLRVLQADNDREHEQLALKVHRDAVADEAGSRDAHGELDADCEARTRRP